MAGQKLSDAQSKKLAGVLAPFSSKDEKEQKNLERFADKYLRWKLGVRGTGPHAHGFSSDQRKAITGAINAAFGIKTPERKTRVRVPGDAKGRSITKRVAAAPSATKRRAGEHAAARKAARGKAGVPGTGAKKTAAQLAKEQTRRAAEGRPEHFTV